MPSSQPSRSASPHWLTPSTVRSFPAHERNGRSEAIRFSTLVAAAPSTRRRGGASVESPGHPRRPQFLHPLAAHLLRPGCSLAALDLWYPVYGDADPGGCLTTASQPNGSSAVSGRRTPDDVSDLLHTDKLVFLIREVLSGRD